MTKKTCSECEQLLGEIYDLRNVMTGYAYGLRVEDVSHVLTNARNHLKKLEGWLELQAAPLMVGSAEDETERFATHLLNGKFTPPDFQLWELLDQFEGLATESLGSTDDLYKDLPRIRAFKEQFAVLPENRFYLESWLHKELPCNNCMAHYGSLPGPKTYVHGESAKLATWRKKGTVELSPH